MRRFNFKDQIVFENTNYLAINKPPGVSSLHERIGLANSVFEQAKKYNNHLQLCHRLDKETSGVLLLSKHADWFKYCIILGLRWNFQMVKSFCFPVFTKLQTVEKRIK